jgi:protein SCO1/2
LSYTIDPNRDTRDVLAAYAVRHGVAVQSRDWLFLRGDESQIHRLAEQYYLLSAGVDSTAPGGFLHSGQFLLLDPKGRIRGLYDGTSADECKVLERDLDALRREWSEEK